MLRASIAVLAAGFLAFSARAATFDIAFFNSSGASAGLGTFVADAVNFAPVTEFSAVVDGVAFTDLVAGGGYASLALIKDFPNAGDLGMSGFAFKPGETVSANSGVLQMDTIGVGAGSGSVISNGWTFASCGPVTCGGGESLGTFVITPSPVPLPAAVFLLPLGLGTLALVGRRRRKAMTP